MVHGPKCETVTLLFTYSMPRRLLNRIWINFTIIYYFTIICITKKLEVKIPAYTGLAVSIWTGAWHIARHINLRRAIKKRRKFHSETKIQSLAILSCTTEYRVFFCICAVFSCHLSCLRRRLKKPGARFHTLKTNEARFKRRASTSQDACGGARARSRASNGQACVYKLHFRRPQVLSCRNSFASPDIFTFKISKCLLVNSKRSFITIANIRLLYGKKMLNKIAFGTD